MQDTARDTGDLHYNSRMPRVAAAKMASSKALYSFSRSTEKPSKQTVGDCSTADDNGKDSGMIGGTIRLSGQNESAMCRGEGLKARHRMQVYIKLSTKSETSAAELTLS